MFAIVNTSDSFIIAAMFCFIAAFTYKKDCQKVEDYIKQFEPLIETEEQKEN